MFMNGSFYFFCPNNSFPPFSFFWIFFFCTYCTILHCATLCCTLKNQLLLLVLQGHVTLALPTPHSLLHLTSTSYRSCRYSPPPPVLVPSLLLRISSRYTSAAPTLPSILPALLSLISGDATIAHTSRLLLLLVLLFELLLALLFVSSRGALAKASSAPKIPLARPCLQITLPTATSNCTCWRRCRGNF